MTSRKARTKRGLMKAACMDSVKFKADLRASEKSIENKSSFVWSCEYCGKKCRSCYTKKNARFKLCYVCLSKLLKKEVKPGFFVGTYISEYEKGMRQSFEEAQGVTTRIVETPETQKRRFEKRQRIRKYYFKKLKNGTT